MDENKNDSSPIMDMLHNAFPNRTDEQIVPIALVYTGMRWGKDFKYCNIPKDKEGKEIIVCKSEDKYWEYLSWLADYLITLVAKPNEEQNGLCKYLDKMLPEDGIQLIGMNAALYQAEIEPMESWIEEGASFSEYAENMRKYVLDDGEKYDEDADRELYDTVGNELKDHHKYCPDVRHADVPYRIPLAITIKKVKTRENRIKLLDSFYQTFDHYISK